MADSLHLSSHLRPPQYNIDLVDRPRLTELLDRAGVRRLLIVHAPAGFGKTTTLYQWVIRLQAAAPATVCWLSVSYEDSDPYRFVYHLHCALAEGRKRSSRPGGAANRSFHTTSLQADVGELVRRLAAVQGRLVMVIDDYHLAESPPNNRILYDVVNSLDDNVTVVVSSRRKPELALPYFKCQGLLASIDADVLKFSEDESKVLFAGGEHAGAAGSVYRQCSGWPMALQLAKLWLREAAVNTTGSWVIDPQASGITDYLSGAVLEQLPNEVAEMMAETSVLDQVNGDVANHVTRRSDCWSLISALSALDALIVPIGSKGEWFRYHQLIREFLQAQLAQRGDEHIAMLHLRASDWFRKHGDLENAVMHAAKAGNIARVVKIIESAGAVRIGLMEGMPALRRVLRHLSKEDIYAHPRLHLAQIWLLAKQGEVGVARQQYDEYVSAMSNGAKPGWAAYTDVHKESLFVGMMLAEVYEDKDFNHADIQRIEAMARDVSVIDHWFQGWVNNLLCVMHTRKGNLLAAAAVNEAATFHYRQVGSDYGQVWMLLHLAVISFLDGRLVEASRAIAKAVNRASIEFANDSGLVSIVRVIESALLLEQNEMSRASEQIFDALTATENSEGWVEIYVQGYRTAIELAYFLDGLEEAIRHVERAKQIALDRGLPRLNQAVLLFQIEILTLDGQLDAAEALVNEHGLGIETHPKMGEDSWRARVRQVVVLARLALYRGEAANLPETLSRYIDDAEQFGRRRAVMELSVILALAEFAAYRRDECVAALRRSLQTAVEEGFRRVFAREGRPMARMLEVMIRHVGVSSMDKTTVAFLAELVTALKSPAGELSSKTETNILSEKELAVLNQSADGNCNKLIARNLGVSVATVKFHLSNVYRKLGVGSRTVAVAVARENNLL